MASPGVLFSKPAPVSVTHSPVIDLSPIRPSKLGMYNGTGENADNIDETSPRQGLTRFALAPAQPAAGLSRVNKTSPSPTLSVEFQPAQAKALAKRGRKPQAPILGELDESRLGSLMK